jgi:hypothetical protein
MPTFKSFEEIESWQKARELTWKVYAVSNQGAFTKDFGLRDQIRRASVSILSNIAEGFERGWEPGISPISLHCERLEWRSMSTALCRS